MQRSFTIVLFISIFLSLICCKTDYYQVKVNGKNIPIVDSLMPVDSQLIREYRPYKIEIDRELSKIISINEKKLVKRRKECELLNFLADLLLEESNNSKNVVPQISLINYGGVRTFLPEGEITVRKIYELMPFENELVIVKLSGKQVVYLLNNLVKKGENGIGGVRFSVVNGEVSNVVIGEKPLNFDDHYWIATSDYLAMGGDGMDILMEKLDVVTTNRKIRDLIIYNLEKKYANGELISPKLDGRIKYE